MSHVANLKNLGQTIRLFLKHWQQKKVTVYLSVIFFSNFYIFIKKAHNRPDSEISIMSFKSQENYFRKKEIQETLKPNTICET